MLSGIFSVFFPFCNFRAKGSERIFQSLHKPHIYSRRCCRLAVQSTSRSFSIGYFLTPSSKHLNRFELSQAKSYTHRFLVVANLGADADYMQEPRYLVEIALPFRIDGRTGLTKLYRSMSAIRQSDCPFTYGDDYLVWLVDDTSDPKLFLNERIAQLRSGKRFFHKEVSNSDLQPSAESFAAATGRTAGASGSILHRREFLGRRGHWG